MPAAAYKCQGHMLVGGQQTWDAEPRSSHSHFEIGVLRA